MRLDENSLVPLYAQVMTDIRQGIEGGKYLAGDRIPSESELSEIYSVSRITIRRAIEELAGLGYLTKKQGKGTYVNPPKLEKKMLKIGRLDTFSELCAAAGRVPGARTVKRSRIAANAELAESLKIDEGSHLIVLRRVRTVDGKPITLETTIFPADEFAFIEDADLGNASVYEIIAQHDCRQPSNMIDTVLEMVRADTETAEELSVSVGEPLFSQVGTIVDEQGRPIFIGKLLILGSDCCFRT